MSSESWEAVKEDIVLIPSNEPKVVSMVASVRKMRLKIGKATKNITNEEVAFIERPPSITNVIRQPP